MAQSKTDYEVDQIVSDKYLVGRRFFFVKWRGFDSSHNTWEPEENLTNCQRLVREYFGGKGLRDTKSQNISSTLMRGLNVSQSRRSSIIALTSLKSSPCGSRRSSIVSQAAAANDSQAVSKIDDLQPVKAERSLPAKIDKSEPVDVEDSNPTETNASDAIGPEMEAHIQTPATPSHPPQRSADQLGNASINITRLSGEQLNKSLEGGKPQSNASLTVMVPKIELVRIDDDVSHLPLSDFDVKKSELKRFGLVEAKYLQKSSVDSTKPKVRASRRSRPSTPYSRLSADFSKATSSSRVEKPVLRQRFAVVDLTTDSWTSADETGLSTSQLESDTDQSWRHSTMVGRKFPNKLQVRLFDRTPRPEVLTSVPFLENFESDTELVSEGVTEDSDKENVVKKRRGRPVGSRSRQTMKKLRTSDRETRSESSRSRKSEMLAPAEVPVKDLPKTDDAMVLLTERNESGGLNMLMFFPRLKLIKSLPEKVADKYYSQAVIDYLRRSMQPEVSVARRSL